MVGIFCTLRAATLWPDIEIKWSSLYVNGGLLLWILTYVSYIIRQFCAITKRKDPKIIKVVLKNFSWYVSILHQITRTSAQVCDQGTMIHSQSIKEVLVFINFSNISAPYTLILYQIPESYLISVSICIPFPKYVKNMWICLKYIWSSGFCCSEVFSWISQLFTF